MRITKSLAAFITEVDVCLVTTSARQPVSRTGVELKFCKFCLDKQYTAKDVAEFIAMQRAGFTPQTSMEYILLGVWSVFCWQQ